SERAPFCCDRGRAGRSAWAGAVDRRDTTGEHAQVALLIGHEGVERHGAVLHVVDVLALARVDVEDVLARRDGRLRCRRTTGSVDAAISRAVLRAGAGTVCTRRE